MAAISSASSSSRGRDRSGVGASRTIRHWALGRRTVPSQSCRTASCLSCSASRSRRGPLPRPITPHIDLHCHSTASDGECAPAEVARRARAVDLAAIALTDHDTTDGVADAQHQAAQLGVRVIPGCEFSVRAPWGELHVLAMFMPYENERLQEFLRATRALVDCGACDDIGDAFRRYLGRGRAAYVEKPLPRLTDVTELVHDVGGLTVAAHLGDHGTEGQIRVFQDQGLDGVEVRHPSHAPAVEQRLTRIAERLGLGISGGSDWHGESEYGESHAPLGGMRVPDTWLEPLERRLELVGRKRNE